VTAPVPLVDADQGRIDLLRRLPAARAGSAAAGELQVLFMTQLLAAMRKTIPENDFLPKSPARSVYEGMFDRSVAEALAARDPLGLTAQLTKAAGTKDFGPTGR